MTERFLSLITAFLITITAMIATPLSASAEQVNITEPTEIQEASTAPTEPETVIGSTAEPSEAPTEAPALKDCPLITDIENLESGAQITWDTYNNNQLYRVYYRKAASYLGSWDDKYAGGVWTRLATVRGNSYLHTNVNDADIGIYTVRCVDSSGDFTSDFYDKGWENCFYAAPKITSSVFDESGVHLSWDQAWKKHGFWNGECYRVYRRTSGSGWTRLEQTADDHYTDATAEIGMTYIYTIRMINSDSTRFLSDYLSGTTVSFKAYPYVSDIENTEHGAQISWYRYSGASSYRVYYRSSDGWTRIAQVTGTSYTDTGVKSGSTRVYTVRALDAHNDFISDFNSAGWSNTFFAPPVIESLTNTTEGVKLTWKRPDGAQSYRVYRKTDGGWLRLGQTDGSSFTDTTAESGRSYTYTVRMITSDDSAFMSDYLSGKRITYVAAPVITDAVNQSSGVKLSWQPIAGADFYRIYYWTGAEWKRLASKYLTEYVDTSVKNGETREYTVRCLDENENFVSDYYRNGYINTFYEPPVIKTLSADEYGITLTWDRAPDAQDYRVYRKTDDSSWKMLTQTDESSYTDTDYEKGIVSYYTLRMVIADGSRFMSDYIGGKSILWCDTPYFSSLTNSENGVELRWNAVKGARQYRVYYQDGSEWIRLDTVHGTAYTDNTITDGQTRVYTVRCVDADGNFISDFNRNGTPYTYNAPPVIESVTYQNNAYTISLIAGSSCRLYRKALGEELIMIADQLDSTAFTDDTVEENGIYTYTLQALNEQGEIISSSDPKELYYQNGIPADGVFSVEGVDYHLSNGNLLNGFFTEADDSYYLSDGIRVEQNQFKKGVYTGVYNRAQWLYELMRAVGEPPQIIEYDSKAVFDSAVQRGIIDSYSDDELFLSVDRRFAAKTIVNALGYSKRDIGTISDIGDNDSALSTVAFYGYFLPDDEYRIFPEATVTPEEFDDILSQLYLYRQLCGKNVLSFGDSIMHGTGSNNISISRLIAEKYGMIYYDYSLDGATIGKYPGKIHIPDQVRKAIGYHHNPDFILINGGTNDMYRGVELGAFTDGYDMSHADESTFTGGFETALWLINNTWKDVPVIYIRAHNTGLGNDSRERLFGERGMKIAEKWYAGGIDLYNGSAMNTEDPYICDRYTFRNPNHNYNHDSIHPNALGYATFYIDPIEEMIAFTVKESSFSIS